MKKNTFVWRLRGIAVLLINALTVTGAACASDAARNNHCLSPSVVISQPVLHQAIARAMQDMGAVSRGLPAAASSPVAQSVLPGHAFSVNVLSILQSTWGVIKYCLILPCAAVAMIALVRGNATAETDLKSAHSAARPASQQIEPDNSDRSSLTTSTAVNPLRLSALALSQSESLLHPNFTLAVWQGGKLCSDAQVVAVVRDAFADSLSLRSTDADTLMSIFRAKLKEKVEFKGCFAAISEARVEWIQVNVGESDASDPKDSASDSSVLPAAVNRQQVAAVPDEVRGFIDRLSESDDPTVKSKLCTDNQYITSAVVGLLDTDPWAVIAVLNEIKDLKVKNMLFRDYFVNQPEQALKLFEQDFEQASAALKGIEGVAGAIAILLLRFEQYDDDKVLAFMVAQALAGERDIFLTVLPQLMKFETPDGETAPVLYSGQNRAAWLKQEAAAIDALWNFLYEASRHGHKTPQYIMDDLEFTIEGYISRLREYSEDEEYKLLEENLKIIQVMYDKIDSFINPADGPLVSIKDDLRKKIESLQQFDESGVSIFGGTPVLSPDTLDNLDAPADHDASLLPQQSNPTRPGGDLAQHGPAKTATAASTAGGARAMNKIIDKNGAVLFAPFILLLGIVTAMYMFLKKNFSPSFTPKQRQKNQAVHAKSPAMAWLLPASESVALDTAQRGPVFCILDYRDITCGSSSMQLSQRESIIEKSL
ncbi:MAG: hypothetical protein NC924_07750 [Candidatus Omnitrophica bacterium]|nr:hypothetical protein [Candidatus Omnitrophota bacterium]